MQCGFQESKKRANSVQAVVQSVQKEVIKTTAEETPATLPAPPPATRFQKANQEYINENPELKKAFKEMQRFAKDKDQLSAFASSVRVLEALTGYPELTAWVIGQFDLNF